MVRDNRHTSAYIFGAICPERGVGAALIMPYANTEAMNKHLEEISVHVAPGSHAVLFCDGAGWHQGSGALVVPKNITLLPLPAYCPELNPMENVWKYLRENKPAPWSGTPTTKSSRLALKPGVSSLTIPKESNPSAIEIGHASMIRRTGIIAYIVLIWAPNHPSPPSASVQVAAEPPEEKWCGTDYLLCADNHDVVLLHRVLDVYGADVAAAFADNDGDISLPIACRQEAKVLLRRDRPMPAGAYSDYPPGRSLSTPASLGSGSTPPSELSILRPAWSGRSPPTLAARVLLQGIMRQT